MTMPYFRKSFSFLLVGLSSKDWCEATGYAPHPPLTIPSQLFPLFPPYAILVSKTTIQHVSTMNHSSIRPAKIICRKHGAVDEAMLKVYLYSLMLYCCNVYFLTETDPERGAAKTRGNGGTITSVNKDLYAKHVALEVCFCF